MHVQELAYLARFWKHCFQGLAPASTAAHLGHELSVLGQCSASLRIHTPSIYRPHIVQVCERICQHQILKKSTRPSYVCADSYACGESYKPRRVISGGAERKKEKEKKKGKKVLGLQKILFPHKAFHPFWVRSSIYVSAMEVADWAACLAQCLPACLAFVCVAVRAGT